MSRSEQIAWTLLVGFLSTIVWGIIQKVIFRRENERRYTNQQQL